MPRNQAERYVEFPLKADQFFVLGDNSAKQQGRPAVGARQLLGPPRAADRQGAVHLLAPFVERDSVRQRPFPVLPQFRRMGLVR